MRPAGKPSTIDLSPITQRNEIENILLTVEFVNYAVIAHPEAILGPAG